MGKRALGKSPVLAAWLVALSASRASAQVLERGTIIDRVQCAGAEQTYALYLPSTYSRDRKWSLLLAFHPAARGRLMVEKFQLKALRYISGQLISDAGARSRPRGVGQGLQALPFFTTGR